MFDFLKYRLRLHLVHRLRLRHPAGARCGRGWTRTVARMAAVDDGARRYRQHLGSRRLVPHQHRVGHQQAHGPSGAEFPGVGAGRVLDAGAGSGRAAVGVLLARPKATVTGLDIYRGYWGIDDNTPERFMKNARIAGVANRADTRTGDMRDMPFHDGEFDAVVSSYAIDHLRRDDLVKGLSEVARVLKPRGEFLVLIVNPDWLTWVFAPPIAHHPRPDPARWRSLLEQAGLAVVEEGMKPATLYFLAQKRTS